MNKKATRESAPGQAGSRKIAGMIEEEEMTGRLMLQVAA